MASKFPKYKLTEKQIRGIARIVDCEQGSIAGEFAEASLMANLIDVKGDEYATVDRLIAFVTKRKGNWFAHGRERYYQGYNGTVSVPNHAIKAVKRVLVEGFRTVPRHIVEHDCLSDISKVVNGTKSDKKSWVRGKTVIYNRYGAVWYFWSFPGGYSDDPFGYKKDYREKWGDFCYTYEQSSDESYHGEPQAYKGIFPVLPDESFGVNRKYYQKGDGKDTLVNYKTQIKRVQENLNWALDINLETSTGIYGDKTTDAVKKLQGIIGTDQNGKFGNICLDYLKKLKK